MKEITNKPWRQQPKGCPYGEGDVTENKQYLEDRTKLFRENGNGWWWLPPTRQQKKGK